MIKFNCVCGKQVSAPDSAAGRSGKCPYCGQRVEIPAMPPVIPPAAPGAPEQAAAGDTIACPKCNYKNEGNSRFCQECGHKLGQLAEAPGQPAEPVPPPLPGSGAGELFTIEFGHSSSSGYELAVETAKKFPTYRCSGEKTKARHAVEFALSAIEPALALWSQVYRWKSSRLLLNGELVSPQETFGFISCKEARNEAYKKLRYCFAGDGPDFDMFNPWGCIELRLPLMGWHQEWLCYGRWDRSGAWHFDKAQIKHKVAQELKRVRFCPHLNAQLIDRLLDVWPDAVNPRKDKDWTWLETYNAGPNCLAVKIVEGDGDFRFERTINAMGVKPVDASAAVRVFSRLLAAAGVRPDEYLKHLT